MNGYALVIGINDYETLPKLDNAINDAIEVANALEKSGFIVKRALDLSLLEFRQHVDSFDDELKGYDVGLFFFAGHGFQKEGINFLAGREFIPGTTFMMKKDGVTLDDLIEKMRTSAVETKIIIMDACRKEFNDGTRGISNTGLAPIFAPRGTLIAFSTSPGEGAKDGEGRKHSHYTSAFLTHIKDENIQIEEFFKRIRGTLATATNGKQTSWEHTSLIGQFTFNNGELRHTKNLPYSDLAIADKNFKANNTGNAIDTNLVDMGGNWDSQNAAISSIQSMDLSKLDDDRLFILGRGLVNGGENDARRVVAILNNLPSWLITHGGNKKHHILNGMLYEIYFDSKGLIRRKNHKTKYLTEICKLESDARFAESFEMINEQLHPFRDRLCYMPSTKPKSLPIDLVVVDDKGHNEIVQKKIISIHLHGKDITVNTDQEDPMFNIKSVSYDEFIDMLSKELIVPKNRITINPPDVKNYYLKIPFSYHQFRTVAYLFEQEPS